MKMKMISTLTVLSLLFLASCGDSKPENEADKSIESQARSQIVETENTTVKNAEATKTNADGSLITKEHDEGQGPATLDIVFGTVLIPKGMDYEVYQLNASKEKIAGQNKINFGIGNTFGGNVLVSTTRMVNSIDDVIGECLRMNLNDGETHKVHPDMTLNDLVYKHISITKKDSTSDFLLAYYDVNAAKRYVQVTINTSGHYKNIDFDNPVLHELLNNIKLTH